ncbi:MAG TPA: hypothetical protein VFV38_27580 [Ktedonobacteraceae bacterium]|nr:hypothetical protein [Ktedonobacteraceae bacterium]
MNKRPVQKHLVHVLLLSLAIILLGSSIALLSQWHQGSLPSYASDDNVVGPPSLPASYVDTIFRRVGSPMVGTGKIVEQASRAQNIDDAFALAVWWTETNDGAAGVGLHDRNPGSVRGSIGYPSAYDGYTIYPSFSAAVTYWFSMMKRVYINRGLTSVYSIAHPYVGTATSNLWAGKVIALMRRYHAEAPKVTPTPQASPTLPPDLVRHAKALWKQDQDTDYSQNTTQNAPTRVQQSSPRPASEPNMPLVLAVLALALGLGLWAGNKNKRVTVSIQLSQLLHESPQRQATTLFNNLTGTLPTTENLTWPLSTNGPLAMSASRQLSHTSETLFPSGALMTAQVDTYTQPVHQSAPIFGRQFSLPGTSTESLAQIMGPTNASLTDLPTQTLPIPPSLHRTRLLPSRPDMAPFANSFPRDRYPEPVGAGHLSAPATETVINAQPQLVGAGSGTGRSNGLLSRYREMQAQGGQV